MLFELVDPTCELFSLETQERIIKLNSILIRSYLMKEKHLLQVLSGKRIGREKLITYLRAFRKITNFIFSQIESLK